MNLAFINIGFYLGVASCSIMFCYNSVGYACAKNIIISEKECKSQFTQAKKNKQLKEKNYQIFQKNHCIVADNKKDSTKDSKNKATKKDKNQPDIDSDKILPKIDQDILKDKEQGVIYPKQISVKYNNEANLRARFLTCQDQYNVNKIDGGNGDVKWIQKGGGYFIRCVRELKNISAQNTPPAVIPPVKPS